MNSASTYLERFKRLSDLKGFQLNGGRILVEILPEPEVKSAGGLILSAPSNKTVGTFEDFKPTMAVVLMTGVGYVNDQGEEIPQDVKVGNIVMLNPMSLRRFSTFPGLVGYTSLTVALTHESDVQMTFTDVQAFEKYTQVLNGSVPEAAK